MVADGEREEFLLMFLRLGGTSVENFFLKQEKEVAELGKIRDGHFFPPLNPTLA